MSKSIAGVSLVLVLISPFKSAAAQTPKYKLVKVNVTSPASPYTVHVGDIVQLNLANQNVGKNPVPTSTVVAGTGTALSPIGLMVLDTTTKPSTYVAFYAVTSLGESTVQFEYDDTSGPAPKKVTKTIVFDVPAYGIGAVVDVDGNAGTPNPINAKVGDTIRLTFKATGPTQSISSVATPAATVLKAGGATFDGTAYVAFFGVNQQGNANIGLNVSGGTNVIFQVQVSPSDPAP